MKLLKNKYIFFGLIFILATIIFLLSKKNNQDCNCGKEGIENINSGRMVGYIKRKIHPIVRPAVRKVKSSFANPTVEYYINKIDQILK